MHGGSEDPGRDAAGQAGPQDEAPPAPSRPPFRNLRVWVESFDLALDIFQMSRRMEGGEGAALARSLIDASSRIPVAVARGQSSGSSTGFVRGLHEALSGISELETHLLMSVELGYLSSEDAAACEIRIREIRAMAAALCRRLLAAPARQGPPVGGRPVVTRVGRRGELRLPRRGERGSALIVALLVCAALGVLGAAALTLADAESRISEAARDRDATLNAAESGAAAVKRWFDAPGSGDPSSSATVRHPFLGRHDMRNPADFDRFRRAIDLDANPLTPPVPADGTPGREFYRQGREVAPGSPHLDFFHMPYRGGLEIALAGGESAPDLVLEDRPGLIDLLDEINVDLFGVEQSTGRLERIELSGPPAGGHGFATVKITAARFRRMDRTGAVPVAPPGARSVSRSIVRMGLGEIPYQAPRGPLEACGDITATGRLRARWGRVIALGDIRLVDQIDRLDAFVDSSLPYASYGRRISGSGGASPLGRWLGHPDPSVEDPWLKVVAGGDLIGYETLADQPFPFDPNQSNIDIDHSNLFQRVPGLACASFPYAWWKRLTLGSMPGDRNLHYFSYDAASGLFRERGQGPARSVRDWTHGRSGVFFFDTTDGAPPGPANLTPPVAISGGDWATAGLIYLNAASFRATSVAGIERVVLPPGEPYDDADHDARHAPGEAFLNLLYPTSVGTGTPADEFQRHPLAAASLAATSPDGETYSISITPGRDPGGTPILAGVNLFGVLYNAGDIEAQGDVVVYGSLIAGGDVTQSMAGADTPIIYFDERLNTGLWPPPEIEIPRTYVTLWQTSRP